MVTPLVLKVFIKNGRVSLLTLWVAYVNGNELKFISVLFST